jgi:hypothetical protein
MLANRHGRLLELSEYGVGGWRNFIVIPKGCEGRGWGACVEKMRKVVNFLEPHSKLGIREEKLGVVFNSCCSWWRMADGRMWICL